MFVSKNPFEYLGVFAAALAVFLSFQSAVVFNDIYDYEIDKISNPKRPLVTGIFTVKEYKNIGKLFLIAALFISMCINEAFFLLILAYNGLAYLYSNPPFRLRTLAIIPNIILAIIAVVTFHAGATLLAGDFTFQVIPSRLTVTLFVGYCFATTIKDLKDTEGDRNEKIKTLSTLLGNLKGRIVTALLISATIIALPFVLNVSGMLIFSILTAALFNVLLFWKNRLKEISIFILYYMYMIVLFYKLVNIL